MANFEVRDVVCDYGVFENGELKLILNSRGIAENIVQLLEEDARLHGRLNPTKDYPPYLDCPKHYSQDSDRTEDKLNLIDMNSINAIAGYLRWTGKRELAEILFNIQEKTMRLLDEYELLKKENQASLQMAGDDNG